MMRVKNMGTQQRKVLLESTLAMLKAFGYDQQPDGRWYKHLPKCDAILCVQPIVTEDHGPSAPMLASRFIRPGSRAAMPFLDLYDMTNCNRYSGKWNCHAWGQDTAAQALELFRQHLAQADALTIGGGA